MFKATGILHYDRTRAVIWADRGITDYYYSLIPKAKYAQRQKHKAHITVVRTAPIEVPTNMDAWKKYEGEKVAFAYNGNIKFDFPYFYIEAWSSRIEEIRSELGLPKFRLSKTCYHITIGNTKR